MTLKERIETILKNSKKSMTSAEIYNEYMKKFPTEVVSKILSYNDYTVKKVITQIKAEISSNLSTNFEKVPQNINYEYRIKRSNS